MKPSREPTPFEKFNDAVKTMLRAPKEVVDAKQKALRDERRKLRKKRPASAR